MVSLALVSAWNKRRRSMSLEHAELWNYKSGKFWQSEDQSSSGQEKRCSSAVFTRKGGFGQVYRGVCRSGEVLAIKKMEMPVYREAEGEREFRVEVDILGRLNPPNLVSLVGYCADGKQRFLVYEFMEKGNLQDQLNENEKAEMDWPMRLKVALGEAKELAYLHSGSAVGIPIVHRDFKSSNILLTVDFDAKVRNLLNNKKKLCKIIDADISQISPTMESRTIFANLASHCVHLESNERSSMAECIKELQLICFSNSKGQGRGPQSFRIG